MKIENSEQEIAFRKTRFMCNFAAETIANIGVPFGQMWLLLVLRQFPFLSLVGYIGLLGGALCLWKAGHHAARGGGVRADSTNHPSTSYWPGI